MMLILMKIPWRNGDTVTLYRIEQKAVKICTGISELHKGCLFVWVFLLGGRQQLSPPGFDKGSESLSTYWSQTFLLSGLTQDLNFILIFSQDNLAFVYTRILSLQKNQQGNRII